MCVCENFKNIYGADGLLREASGFDYAKDVCFYLFPKQIIKQNNINVIKKVGFL